MAKRVKLKLKFFLFVYTLLYTKVRKIKDRNYIDYFHVILSVTFFCSFFYYYQLPYVLIYYSYGISYVHLHICICYSLIILLTPQIIDNPIYLAAIFSI